MDTFLLLIAFLAQIGCAVLGYTVSTRPPDPKRRKYFEGAFICIAVVGAVAIFWSGYRSGNVQDEILSGIHSLVPEDSQTPSTQDAKKIASLFNQIDPNIMNAINQGHFDLTVRMQPTDLAELRMILTQDDSKPPLAVIQAVGAPMYNDLVDNGSLGPSGPEYEQYQVAIHVDKAVAVDNAP